KSELDKIIKDFNERWFASWDATPDEQREVFFTFTEKITQHPDYADKYLKNKDPYTRELAYNRIMEDVAKSMRKVQIECAKQWMDQGFKQEFKASTQRYLGR